MGYIIISYSMWYSHIFPTCLMIYRFSWGVSRLRRRFFWGFGICFSGSWCVRPSPTAPSFCRCGHGFRLGFHGARGEQLVLEIENCWKMLKSFQTCGRNHEETMTLGINEDLGFLKSVCFAVLSELARYSTLLPAQVSAFLPSGKCGEKWPEGLGN